MNKLKSFFVAFRMAVLLTLFIPMTALAANVGFIPSTGIWFSRTTFLPKENIRVYAVVINNDYARLDGTVAFYDNNEIIDTVAVSGLMKDTAQQIRVFWQPNEGTHSVSARFTNAVATDEKGQTIRIGVGAINNQTGLPLIVGQGGQVSPETADVAGDELVQPQSGVVGPTVIEIKKQDNKLAIAAPAVLGVKIAVATAGSASSTSLDELFAKNREVLDKAKSAVDTVSSTAAKIGTVYTTAKDVIDKGQAAYDQAKSGISAVQEWLQKTQPYLDKVKAAWNKITNNGEPKRIMIVVGSILLILFLIWRRIRQGLDQQF